MMFGYCPNLKGYFDCTGRWRWSPWHLMFRWFGVLRLEVEYEMGHEVTGYRKANTWEWQQIVKSQRDEKGEG